MTRMRRRSALRGMWDSSELGETDGEVQVAHRRRCCASEEVVDRGDDDTVSAVARNGQAADRDVMLLRDVADERRVFGEHDQRLACVRGLVARGEVAVGLSFCES